MNEQEIFVAAIQITEVSQREAYLNEECGNDAELRSRVEALLQAHYRAADFLESPPPGLDATATKPVGESIGTVIGSYRLLQQLGEGGMGVVYLAERQQPVKQRVALKIIKHGMDSKKFIARFEAERQALAMMDHPNIAKVFDAGCTEHGRPYFVMELVKGVTISQFCDDNRLTTRERLALFVHVCQAVHHAHQKGIIHRDLKPSNVLVALYDDKPVPKVIDFGVAKATNQQLTEKTLFTEVGTILGTWEYMSPEQAVLNQLDVDTRTDVYSLGVLLYELLTGETPLDRQRLRDVQIMETLRMIREDDPPKPSTRVSSQGTLATAAYRKAKPETLASEIRGDLDWIVMKALAKERARRYDSASRLSEDIQRHVNGELVEARPPSTWYHLHKLYGRHKPLVASLAVVFLFLVVGLATALWGLRRANKALADLRELATLSAFDAAMAGDLERARELTELALQAHESPSTVASILALTDLFRGEPRQAIAKLEPLNASEDSIAATAALAIAYGWDGQVRKGLEQIRRLDSLEDRTPYDRALRAFARKCRWEGGDESTTKELKGIVEKYKHWGIAHFFYANHLRVQAENSGDLTLALQAVDESEIVARSVQSESLAATVPALTNHVAYLLARDEDGQLADKCKQRCQQAIEMLPDQMLHFAGWFYDDCGDAQAALAAWGRWDVANHKESSVRRVAFIGCLLRNNGEDVAKEVLQHDPDDNWADLNKCLVAVYQSNYGRCKEIAERLLARTELDPQAQSMALAVLFLTDQTDLAVATAHRWLSEDWVDKGNFEEDIWRFMCQPIAGISEVEELLARAKHSRFNECRAHFYIGVRFLAQKQIAESLRQFHEASDLGIVHTVELQWARVLLHKLAAVDDSPQQSHEDPVR